MSFRPMLRPGQGFKKFRVLRREGGTTDTGRPRKGNEVAIGEFYAMLTQASPEEREQHKQRGTPITHFVVQRGTKDRAKATDVIALVDAEGNNGRRFHVKGDPNDPGELGHFLIYKVEERDDLNE